MVPAALERVLATWDPARGRRPHVLYLVPCGQNPTGSTLSLERRLQIYAIAQKYDLVIVEDGECGALRCCGAYRAPDCMQIHTISSSMILQKPPLLRTSLLLRTSPLPRLLQRSRSQNRFSPSTSTAASCA